MEGGEERLTEQPCDMLFITHRRELSWLGSSVRYTGKGTGHVVSYTDVRVCCHLPSLFLPLSF